MNSIDFLCPFWGSEDQDIHEFIDTALANGFSGIEIHVPDDINFEDALDDALKSVRSKRPDFILVVQQVSGVKKEMPHDYLWSILKRLGELKRFKPNFINSHTGKDHYSFADNCSIIEALEDFGRTTRIPIYHEIHRGRFTFHSATTLQYLKQFPELKLVGDLSHWCVVSESMLEDQQEILDQIIPHIHHIHARVGFQQAPQVNHPFAPEWNTQLQTFLDWWQAILNFHRLETKVTITPEFGPFPYMPQLPFDKTPLANQKQLNLDMKTYLQTHLN